MTVNLSIYTVNISHEIESDVVVLLYDFMHLNSMYMYLTILSRSAMIERDLAISHESVRPSHAGI